MSVIVCQVIKNLRNNVLIPFPIFTQYSYNLGYLYHPNTNRCYLAHRQGPCPEGHKLTLPTTRYVPECRKNFCNQDGLVQYNRSCYKLNEPGPCPHPELSNVLGIDTKTFALKCIRLSESNIATISTRFGDEDDNEMTSQTNISAETDSQSECRIGSRRSYQGKCNV